MNALFDLLLTVGTVVFWLWVLGALCSLGVIIWEAVERRIKRKRMAS